MKTLNTAALFFALDIAPQQVALPTGVTITGVVDDNGPMHVMYGQGAVLSDSTPLLIGEAPANANLLLRNSLGDVLGFASSDAFGRWAFQLPPLQMGSHNILVQIVGSDMAPVSFGFMVNPPADAPVFPTDKPTLELSGTEDTAYVFGRADLNGFTEQTGIKLISHITVNSLPADGVLQLLDGGTWRAVRAGERIQAADIRAERLRFVPDANEAGTSAYEAVGVGNMRNIYAELDIAIDGLSPGTNTAELTLQMSIKPGIDNQQTIAATVERVGAVAELSEGNWARYSFNVSGRIGDDDGSERSRIEITPIQPNSQFAILSGGVYTVVTPGTDGKIWLNPGDQLMVRDAAQSGGNGSSLKYRLIGEEVNIDNMVLLSKELLPVLTIDTRDTKSWMITGNEDQIYIFGAKDLTGMSTAISGQTAQSVQVKSLPSDGVLQLRDAKGAWKAVALDQVVTAADIRAGKLRFVPDANESGSAAYKTAGVGNMKDVYAELKLDVLATNKSVTSLNLQVAINPLIDNTQTVTASASRVGQVAALGDGTWTSYNFTVSGKVNDIDGSERSRIEITLTNPNTTYVMYAAGRYTVLSPDVNGKIWLHPGAQLLVREYQQGVSTGSTLQYRLMGEEINIKEQVLVSKALTTVQTLEAWDVKVAGKPLLATGTEDTPYVFGTKDLTGMGSLAGAQSPQSVIVESLPSDGVLQLRDAKGAWKAVAADQVISAADIKAGKLRFVPDANESGSAAYKTAGVGNMKNVYAELQLEVLSEKSHSTLMNLQMAINPVVDANHSITGNAIRVGVVNELKGQGLFTGQWFADNWNRYEFNVKGSLSDTDGSERVVIEVRPEEMTGFAIYDAGRFTIVSPGANGTMLLKPGQSLYVQSQGSGINYRLLGQEVNANGDVLAEKELGAGRLRRLSSPIILDLDSNGVQTTVVEEGVVFDLEATGKLSQVAWTDGIDGFLVLDRNGDGLITDGAEMFGEHTRLADGSRAEDGFAALRELDSNGDGLFNAADDMFDSVQVWVDGNRDGVSQLDELLSLKALGIASIDLTAKESQEVVNGNHYALQAGYTREDGSRGEAIDVWLQIDSLKDQPSNAALVI